MLWLPEHTPTHSALLKRGEFIDPARDGRVVPYKMYYPAPDHGLEFVPVILWSHGFGGSRDGAAFISRYLAIHGYAVIHLTHAGTDSSLWEGKKEHPWDILRKMKIARSVTFDRFRDVPFALDALKKWAGEHPEITQRWDFERLGISGHSFGAMTAQVIAGQLVPDEYGALVSMADHRFKAGIAYSPVPISHLSDAPDTALYGPINIPLLHMTGTKDTSPLASFAYDHRLLVHEHTDHPEKYLLVKNEGDHMVYNGTRGKLKANPHRERHEDIIKTMAHGFWDAQLKADNTARQWLTQHSRDTFLKDDATFTWRV